MGAHSTELARAMEIHMISIPQSVLMNLLSRVLRLSLNIYQSEHPPHALGSVSGVVTVCGPYLITWSFQTLTFNWN